MKQRKVKWRHQGIAFGLLMYLFTTLLLPFIVGSSITGRGALIGIPVWVIGGLIYGWLIRSTVKKSPTTTESKIEKQ